MSREYFKQRYGYVGAYITALALGGVIPVLANLSFGSAMLFGFAWGFCAVAPVSRGITAACRRIAGFGR